MNGARLHVFRAAETFLCAALSSRRAIHKIASFRWVSSVQRITIRVVLVRFDSQQLLNTYVRGATFCIRVFHVRLWCDVMWSNQTPMRMKRTESIGWH